MTLEEQFQSLTLADLRGYVAAHRAEDLTLEFKTVDQPGMDRDDRKNLAVAVSGFANSSGGLIVWGIEATRNEDNIDCASGLPEIGNLPLFTSRLNEFSGAAANPTVEGVIHRELRTAGTQGFAITLVPESDSGPHMAKLGEDRYYKRSGASFYKMEHFDVEDMFGRRKKPKLEITTRLVGNGAATTIALGIGNNGRGTAKAPYLAFDATRPFSPGIFGLDGNRNDGLPKLHRGQGLPYRYGASGLIVIHPGTTHEVTSLDLGMNAGIDRIPDEEVIITYEISAEDSRIVKGSVNLGRIAVE